MKKLLLFTLILGITQQKSIAQTLTTLVKEIPSSIRGLDTYSNKTVWISGSNGFVGLSNNSGKDWQSVNPHGYENYDFRDIIAFSDHEAIIINAGSPAVVLRTTNSGKTWEEVYRDDRKEIFLDAIDFHGKNGYILGDPIDGLFQILHSTDKGKTWKDVSQNFMVIADDGEAAFAASGSSLKVFKDFAFIGTGGLFSGLFYYSPKNLRVDKYECPIWYGNQSSGIFAIDFLDSKTGIAVGGNYLLDQDNRNNIMLTYDGGKNWTKPETPVSGYRSDVMYLTKRTVIATGTSGTDISYDGGKNWNNISDKSFNTIGKSANNKIIYLTGSDGNVYRLDL